MPGRRRTAGAAGRRSFAACLVIATLILLSCAPVAGAVQQTGSDSVGFAVQPLQFVFDVAPGASTTHTITITNTETTATKYTFSKEDFSGDRADPAATPILRGGKLDTAISGFDWIQLPEAVTIPGGGSRSITVKVTAPAGATGGHYAALLVNGESRRAGQIIATSRIGVLFSMNAGGAPPPEIVITEIKEVGPTKTVTRFINEGTTTIKDPSGTITKDPVGGGPKRTITGECTRNVMPGAAGECTFEDTDGAGSGSGRGIFGGDGALGGLGPVERYVDIVGDPGEGEVSARGELPTEWAGTWSSLLLPIVGVALFVLYFLFLRRRRKGSEDSEDDDGELAWSGSEPG